MATVDYKGNVGKAEQALAEAERKLSAAFTPEQVEALKVWIDAVIEHQTREFLKGMADGGPLNLHGSDS